VVQRAPKPIGNSDNKIDPLVVLDRDLVGKDGELLRVSNVTEISGLHIGSGIPFEHNHPQSAFSYYARLERLERFVSENFREHISAPQAARIAGLGEKYFSTFFREKTGVCFRDWLASIRIAEAKRLLETRNHSITRVGLEVGFQDPRTFERAFKKLTGMTPSEFKKLVRPG
jgi:AraC-like DNA-binding protein